MEAQNPNEKAVRLVEYLLRLASLRTKPIRDIAEYEKIFWISNIPDDPGCYTQAWGRDKEHEPDEWIEVKNRRQPELPAVPSLCKAWVRPSSLHNKNVLPELKNKIIKMVKNPDWFEGSDLPETIPHTERLEEHPKIQQTWKRFIEDKWSLWRDEHNTWEKVHNAYSDLFSIHQEQLRLGEEYELVLGLGLLKWQTTTGQRIRRHLIVADAILDFEARLSKFTVRPHTEGAKLRPELDMLDIQDQPAHAEEKAKTALVNAVNDPWNKGCIKGVLQFLVHSISAKGDYEDRLAEKNIISDKPIVEYTPALILRKRSVKGLSETLNRIKERIENGQDIPGEFADLAEIPSTDNSQTSNDTVDGKSPYDGEIFFPKPSNDEQRLIVDKMRAANGVLVQGPPGTGKSHTIANLICHLLATGQRILITAKTPRALKVLESLIPGELRPLCINLLGSGNEERHSLESSVKGILSKNGEWNEEHAKIERMKLESRLQNFRKEQAEIDRRLHDIRESETHSQSIAEGSYQGTAARIAEAVNRDRKDYGWFTDTIHPDKTCNISVNDLLGLLKALRRFTEEKRSELNLTWPRTLPSSEHFAKLVQNATKTADEALKSAPLADERVAYLLSMSKPEIIEEIRNSLSNFRSTKKKLMMSPHSWMNEAISAVLCGNSSFWQKLLRITRDILKSIETLVEVADNVNIDYPGNINKKSLHEDARVLRTHLKSGGSLGWGPFRPKAVRARQYVFKTVRIGGQPCSTVGHLSSLCDALLVPIKLEIAWGFWEGRSVKTQGSYALQLTALKSLCDDLEKALSLEEIIDKCSEALHQCPSIDEPDLADDSQVDSLIASCRIALVNYEKRRAVQKLQDIEAQLSFGTQVKNAHSVTSELLSAVRERNINGFVQAGKKIQDLEKKSRFLQKIDENLSKLHPLLPKLTEELKQTYNEPFWNERLQHFRDAWHWAQARYWIEEYIRKEDIPALAKRAKQITDEINESIAKLASLHAWTFCFSRLKEDEKRLWHMEAWQQEMKKLGKGTGKNAPRHRHEAQMHLNQCRKAVPAWVMPLHRVWDTVDPEPRMFDAIIVDEASQCGVEALPLFYMSKKLLIVGDDKQISPEAVGLKRDEVYGLREQFLHDFRFKASFDIQSSLFDHGKLRYGTRRVTLREHFRCMPEIIRFSNDLCYSDTPLIPLRQYGPNRLVPLEHEFVRGGYREGSGNRVINRPEAEAVVERIVKICGDGRYDGKSIGVVVLQGEGQAFLIENQLLESIGAEEMEQRRLICGNPYSFQGDERDIMLLSLVTATNEKTRALTTAFDERRFNVAASRARDQMILFHSVTRKDLNESCFRRQLIEFFEENGKPKTNGLDRDELERRAAQDNRSIVNPPKPFDSWFEVSVALELLRKGFNVRAQHEIAGKRIDLVVEGGRARLAVECDGDKWHGADRYEADMLRQRQLERCGWEFFRVRESVFYADKKAALEQLWSMLEERGIFPISYVGESHTEEKEGGYNN